ncbi:MULTISPECIES: efflux RND transporter permease subunit [unclassified Xanthobacter]|uniref:efflux RND transporter permease subunit n=1 Tax=unclassified Xanthobacter TaxID=2623496 RepID=UPI001EDD6E6B
MSLDNPTPAPVKLGIAGTLTRIFITSPLTPLLLMAAFAFGIIALVTLPREEEPQISVPMVDIHIEANGLKAEDAVKLVTEPLETIVKSIDGVEHVYSNTNDDGVLVTARFLVGTNPDAAILRVHEKIRANYDRMPVGIPEPLIVGRSIDDVAILVVTLTPKPDAAARWTANGLTRIARELQVEIAKLPDIGLTYIVGDQPEEIRVEPDPEKLSLYGITLAQLSAKIDGANRSFQAGTVREKGQQRTLVAGQTLQTPTEIGNLLLTARDGRPVYVRDVATVTLATEPNDTRVFDVRKGPGGDALMRVPAVSLAIAKRPGTNAVLIAEEVLKRLDQISGQMVPADVEMSITRNYGESANEKANELLLHLGLATVSIVLLVGVAIGWREALVVAVVIPSTILLTLFASRLMGYTLNRVSLFALIFSIGILVDDAIVIIENIARHWAMKDGRKRDESAVLAVAEVGNPTIVATLTVVAALLPMLFVSGMMGPYMSPIPANASAAMVFSFFVAVVLTPWLMLKVASSKAAVAHAHEGAGGGKLGHFYVKVAEPILRTKARAWTFLLVVGAVTLASLSLFYTEHVTVKLLPFDNKTELNVVLDLPQGASVEDTNRTLQQMVDLLASVPEVVSFQTYAGTASPFNFNGLVRHYNLRSAPRQGDIQVNLTPKGDRHRTSHDIALELRERLKAIPLPAGSALKVVEPPPGPPVLATLLAEIYGPDAKTRRAVAAKVREAFESVPFIVDVDDSYGTLSQRVRLAIDQDNLEFYKVEQGDVYDAIRAFYGGTTVGYSHRGEGRPPIPIRLSLSKADRQVSPRSLSTPVPANALPGGRGVMELGDVVNVTREPSSYPIFRHNGRAAEMVTADLAGAYEAPVYGMIAVSKALDAMDWGDLPKPKIALHGQPADESQPTLLWDGEWEVTWVTFRDMGGAFGVAILGIYILVVAQFGSFKLPLVILTPIPLTFIGILAGHWLFNAPFSAPSMIGFIALAGIIVRNSILLVDFIRHARTPGRPLKEVLLEAGAIRFKPILLTALAAMIGAAVILTDPIFQGLAISLFFGLLSSTALTVLVIPAIYVALRGDKPAPEQAPHG